MNESVQQPEDFYSGANEQDLLHSGGPATYESLKFLRASTQHKLALPDEQAQSSSYLQMATAMLSGLMMALTLYSYII